MEIKETKLNKRSKILYSITFTMLITAFVLIVVVKIRFKIVMVITGSMEPAIMINSLSVLDKCNIEDVKINDIIMFKSRNGYNITHRVAAIELVDNELELITKGDNNTNRDIYPTKEDNFIGKVIVTNNKVAKLFSTNIKIYSLFDYGTVILIVAMLLIIVGVEVKIVTLGIKYIKKKNKG